MLRMFVLHASQTLLEWLKKKVACAAEFARINANWVVCLYHLREEKMRRVGSVQLFTVCGWTKWLAQDSATVGREKSYMFG